MFIQLISIMDFLAPGIGMDKGYRDMNETWTSGYGAWRERAAKKIMPTQWMSSKRRPGVMGA